MTLLWTICVHQKNFHFCSDFVFHPLKNIPESLAGVWECYKCWMNIPFQLEHPLEHLENRKANKKQTSFPQVIQAIPILYPTWRSRFQPLKGSCFTVTKNCQAPFFLCMASVGDGTIVLGTWFFFGWAARSLNNLLGFCKQDSTIGWVVTPINVNNAGV